FSSTSALLAIACADEVTGEAMLTQTESDDELGEPVEESAGDGEPVDSSTGDGETGDDEPESTGDGDGEPVEESTGDGDGDGDDPLGEIPPEQWEQVPGPDGVPSPLPGVYDDLGEADPGAGFRSLLGLRLRNREALVDFTIEASDPDSDIYGQWLSVAELMDDHAPLESDFVLLQAWLEFEGFSVDFLASNRMLIQFGGTVGQFNEVFGTTLHVCMRKNPQQGNPPIPVYCAIEPMSLPLFV